MSKYVLSKVLVGHNQDVKAVLAPSNDLVLSVSRDTTLRAWKLKPGVAVQQSDDGSVKSYVGHTKFVNSVTMYPPKADNPQGLYVSGGSDKAINLFNPSQPNQPTLFLTGHTDNVCSLDIMPDGRIISGSWDKTARVWSNWQCQFVLEGHTQAVWAVKALVDRPQIVTGSADKTIRIWNAENGQLIKVIQAHTDCVRGLAEVPGLGFISCGNDSAIKVWTYEGDLIQELFGHTSFIYSVAVFPNATDKFASSGEDRTVRIWEGGECVQTITLPAVSVWSVAIQPNGDLVVGANDGEVRIFSKDPQRAAPPETIEAFEASVAAQQVPANQVGDVNKDELPDSSALLEPGNKEGQVKMVRNGNVVEAHQWAGTQWLKIGEVVDAVGQNRKQVYNGKEYDYVFDINIAEGAPNLKLPYNLSENAYTAAMDFIQKNDLPVAYIDQVSEFITNNTQHAKNNNNNSNNNSNMDYVDPYTGASRYVAQGEQQPMQQQQFQKPKINHGFPILERLSFKQVNIPAILSKLKQLNQDSVPKEVQLEESDLDIIANMFTGDSKVSKEGINQLVHITTKWPANHRFPGLDLLRILTLNQPNWWTPGFSPIDIVESSLGSDHYDVRVMLGCRLLTNMIYATTTTSSIKSMGVNFTEFISKVSDLMPQLSPNTKMAYCSLFVNLSVLSHDNSGDFFPVDYTTQLFLSLCTVLKQMADTDQSLQPSAITPNHSEAVYRGLVALGNFFSLLKSDAIDLIDLTDIKPTLLTFNANSNYMGKVRELIHRIQAGFL